jgi:hypothetical protein
MKCRVIAPVLPRSLFGITATICVLAIGSPAEGEEAPPAASLTEVSDRELMDRGFAALKRKDLETAHAAFQEVWGRRPQVVVGLSLAEVEMRLGRFAEAAEHWQYVLLTLPEDMSAGRDSARQQLDLCRGHIGALTVRVTPDGSSVVVNDKPVGESPLRREVFLEPGAHSVYAIHRGRRSNGHTFQVSPGSRLSFTLTVPGAANTPPMGDAARPTASVAVTTRDRRTPVVATGGGHTGLRTPVIIAGGASALAAAALGSYFAVRSNDASDNAASARRTVEAEGDPNTPTISLCAGSNRPAACDELASSVDDVKRFRTLSVGAYIGAGVLAVGTVAAVVLWKERATVTGANAAHVSIDPLFGSLSGLAVSGQF